MIDIALFAMWGGSCSLYICRLLLSMGVGSLIYVYLIQHEKRTDFYLSLPFIQLAYSFHCRIKYQRLQRVFGNHFPMNWEQLSVPLLTDHSFPWPLKKDCATSALISISSHVCKYNKPTPTNKLPIIALFYKMSLRAGWRERPTVPRNLHQRLRHISAPSRRRFEASGCN